MYLFSRDASMIFIIIHVFPDDKEFDCYFDNNKNFGDLKNDLIERQIIMEGTYYFEMNDHIINDDMVLKDNGIINNSHLNIIRNDCIKIGVEMKDNNGKLETIQLYILISDFKVIKIDKNKVIKSEEIKHVIDVLKDESSDHLSILEDLCTLLDKCLICICIYLCIHNAFIKNLLYKAKKEMKNLCITYLEMGFLSSASELLEYEKENDEKIINLLVIIINKIYDKNFKEKGRDLYKIKDAIDPLYNIMIDNFNSKIKEDTLRLIITIGRKYPSDVINNSNIKNCYKDIIPSDEEYYYIDKKYIYILFKEMIKERIIKKGGCGSELVENILFIREMILKKKDIFDIEEDYINIINDFITTSKEEGFEGKVLKENKNEIVLDFIYFEWKELCKEDENSSGDSSKGIMKEVKIKIKEFCHYIASYSFDIQMEFINKFENITLSNWNNSSDEYKCFNTRKNGLFLYYYLPLLFKLYHLEEIFPEFLKILKDKYEDIPSCYVYIIKLYNEIMERMMKEEKDIEINEENIIIIIFLWSVVKEEGRKENEVEYLINSTVKVLEWLGKIEEEKEEEIKEEEKESVKEEDKNEEGMKENVNRKEIIIYGLLYFITNLLNKSKEDKEKAKKDGRIGKVLLEIVRNHIENERCLIEKGNKKKMIEYIIYSYSIHIIYPYNEDVKTSDLLSLPSPSFPFCYRTIIDILGNIYKYFLDIDNNELIKRNSILDIVELLNDYVDIIKIIDECDIKKEIEGEIVIEWTDDIINKIYKKISFDWSICSYILISYFSSSDSSSLNDEYDNIIKRIISIIFSHRNNCMYIYKEDREKKNNDMENTTLIRPFMIDEKNRRDFIEYFISIFTNNKYYSMLDMYYLVNNSEEDNIFNIYMKILCGEIVDIIKKREGNNIRKERKRFEREKDYGIYYYILISLKNIIKFSFQYRNYNYLGDKRKYYSYMGKEEIVKECKDYISNIVEEKDMRECLILYLKHMIKEYNRKTFKYELKLSSLSEYSNNTLYYLLSINDLKQ